MKSSAAILGLIIGLPVFVGTAVARDTTMPERFNVGGFPAISKTTPYRFEATTTPRPLPEAGAAALKRNRNQQARLSAQVYMDEFPATTGMLLIENGKIIFEGYQGQGSDRAEFYSQSIGKSMTSLAVGQALCRGRIRNLEMQAGEIVPELKVNNLGKSTIRQLLTMSSGAYMTKLAGQPQFEGGIGRRPLNGKPFFGTPWPIRLGQTNIDDLLWGSAWDKIKYKNERAPGAAFVYKALDTQALGKVIERLTGNSLAAYFDRTVWQEVRGAGSGHWEADRNGSTVAYAGVQFRLRDWGRIAVWVLEQRKRTGCFGDYLRTATTTQIANSRLGSGTLPRFSGYGYQWWTDHPTVPGFWGKGYAGQEMGLNPETGKILIKFGYKANTATAAGINRLFRQWHRK